VSSTPSTPAFYFILSLVYNRDILDMDLFGGGGGGPPYLLWFLGLHPFPVWAWFFRHIVRVLRLHPSRLDRGSMQRPLF